MKDIRRNLLRVARALPGVALPQYFFLPQPDLICAYWHLPWILKSCGLGSSHESECGENLFWHLLEIESG